MRALCFTVDLDRDVNIQIPGSVAAGSIDRGSGTGPRFSSSGKGLSLLVDLLDEINVKATFFAEASTLRKVNANLLSGHEVGIHGVDHEDLATIEDVETKRKIIREAAYAVKDAVGRAPVCFRAPYMRADDEVMSILPEFDITIDSSRYTEISRSLMPERLRSGVWEMPVPEGMDAIGKKISAYLWPMHESKRKPEDYLEMASAMEEGAFVLATHTWHIIESRERGMMSSDETKNNMDNVREVLEGMMDTGMRPLTLVDVKNLIEAKSR